MLIKWFRGKTEGRALGKLEGHLTFHNTHKHTVHMCALRHLEAGYIRD